MATLKPEQKARLEIDRALEAAGWIVQDMDELNLSAGRGVAVREYPMASGHGKADYLLFVDKKAVRARGQARRPKDLGTPGRPTPRDYVNLCRRLARADDDTGRELRAILRAEIEKEP